MKYKPTITPPDQLKNPSWLCPGCGELKPFRADEPSYPRCKCGERMTMIHAENLPYVVRKAVQQEIAGG